ncbi:hypothetical protein CRG98_007975 [Punica granatum]|uniref:Uncharacterized protein n=1 Tax=Punica granatum TaxID=22663 RepID=A0A2I0KT46_PUNGR|nr:hypothetical protein CRG98_007975 [Punica granatum]
MFRTRNWSGAARTQAPAATNYDVGSTTWADLRLAPLPSAMKVTILAHGPSWSPIEPVQAMYETINDKMGENLGTVSSSNESGSPVQLSCTSGSRIIKAFYVFQMCFKKIEAGARHVNYWWRFSSFYSTAGLFLPTCGLSLT